MHYVIVKIVHLIQDEEKSWKWKSKDWLTKLYTLYHIHYNFRKKFHFVEHSQEIEIIQVRIDI